MAANTLSLADYAVDGLTPREVLSPRSAEEVSDHLHRAAAERQGIIPRGGGTQMALGNIPRAADVVLCTAELNQVLEYEPADLVVTVQAGVRLARLQRVLGEQGQFLALDPAFPERATVGGIIATNASGPLRLRYGTCRDLLIGIKVAGADGAITKAGGKVVKNVTGYDMCKLYTGSLGTLAVIVEASFKVAPLPAIENTVLCWFGALSDAITAARAIYNSPLPIRACELISPSAAAALELAGGYLLAVWIGGGQTAVERQQREVTGLCSAANAAETVAGNELQRFWREVEDFGREQFEIVGKISVPPSRTGELLARLPADAPFVSHVLSGVTYVFGLDAELLTGVVREVGGYLVLEACPLEVKRRLDVWGPLGGD
ncbi:MAG TPA: FAD-binding oxidoreductase, partial [Chloroflexota bacterium]|nr:FAD-binding oxidoreductase [Chloroflexota bacterium]